MEFRILGPMEAREEGRPLALGAAKQRALLGVLLLHANEVVGSERLVDELWGEHPPRTATKLVQGYVSSLRKIVGGDVLVTRSPGYLLRVEPGQLDLIEFSRLTDEARDAGPARASDILRAALELWRGAPLADLRFEGASAVEVARLEDLRLTAHLERVENDISLGRHTDVIPDLEGLAAEHPYHERLRGQLMVALYRSGRQTESLRVYQELRRRLVDELGLEPGRELKQLEQAILVQDRALDPPALVTPPAEDAPAVTRLEPDRAGTSQARRWNRPWARVFRETAWASVRHPLNLAIVAMGAVLGLVLSAWVALAAALLVVWRIVATVRAVRNWHGLQWVGVRAQSLARIAPEGELRGQMKELVSACASAAQLDAAAERLLGQADRKSLRRLLEHAREQYDLRRADVLARQMGALDRIGTERHRLQDESDRLDSMIERIRGELFRARIESPVVPGELAATLQGSVERIRAGSAALRAALEDANASDAPSDSTHSPSARSHVR
jgi:DNA-binding SARP family transcriptional activator